MAIKHLPEKDKLIINKETNRLLNSLHFLNNVCSMAVTQYVFCVMWSMGHSKSFAQMFQFLDNVLKIKHHFTQRRSSRALCLSVLLAIHYSDVIMGTMSSQITSLMIVYSTIYSGADQRKHQISASLAFVRGIHWWPVNSLHKWPVTRKMFTIDGFIMYHLSVILHFPLSAVHVKSCLLNEVPSDLCPPQGLSINHRQLSEACQDMVSQFWLGSLAGHKPHCHTW